MCIQDFNVRLCSPQGHWHGVTLRGLFRAVRVSKLHGSWEVLEMLLDQSPPQCSHLLFARCPQLPSPWVILSPLSLSEITQCGLHWWRPRSEGSLYWLNRQYFPQRTMIELCESLEKKKWGPLAGMWLCPGVVVPRGILTVCGGHWVGRYVGCP